MASVNQGFPASNLISPSVRIAEQDLSFLPLTPTVGQAALVGFASKGPINLPTLVTSVAQLNTIFGYPHPATGDPYMIYAGTQFLQTGNQLYCVRVAEQDQAYSYSAQTANIEIPTSGGPVVIVGNVAVGSGFTFPNDVFFRWNLNGTPASKVLVVLADSLRPSPEAGFPYQISDLVNALNNQLVPAIDGIIFGYNNASLSGAPTTASQLTVSSYFSYGPSASIEMVSVLSSLYGPGSVVGLGTGMTAGVLTASDTQYPVTSVLTPGIYDFSSFATGAVQISIVVNGTNNVNIDNVVQTITLNSAYQTIATIVNTINTAVNNGSVPGGFVASSTAGALTLTTLTYGQNALIFVKPISTAAPLLGFTGGTGIGTTPTAVTGNSTYAAGLVTGNPNSINALCFTVNADSPGIDGNQTQLVITNSTTDGTFILDVYSYGQQVEIWGGISKNPLSTQYIETVINQVSNYISIIDNTANAAPPLASSPASPYALSGGADGIPPNPTMQDQLLVGSTVGMSGIYALSDPEQIFLDLVAVPGHSSTTVANAIINLCQNVRGDCIGIIEPPFGLTVTEIIQWQNGVSPLNDVQFNSSFAALYWPWVLINDNFNNIPVWVPPSGNVLAAYAAAPTPWAAVAGLTSGVVPGVQQVFSNPTLSERDQMYGGQNAINPIIAFVGQAGFYIWGNKTLQRLPSALDRVNTRRMLNYVEKTIAANSKILLFQPQTPQLWASFIQIASNVLNTVLNGGGIADYIVQCDATLNTAAVIDMNEMRANIGILPTYAVEFIFILFTLNNNGNFAITSNQFST